MRTPGLARLIMLSGSSGGCGKSTAMRGLAERYRAAGREVMAIDEDSVWGVRRLDDAPVDHTTASPMFYALLHRKVDDQSPAPAEVVRVFGELVTEAVSRNAVWLQDWCWPELVGMLGWDAQVAQETSRQLLKVAAPVDPQVVYLRVDPRQALQRALAERGPVWFNRHTGTPGQAVTAALVGDLAARRRAAEPSRITALAGWRTTFLDAARGQQHVLDSIWQVVEQPAALDRG